MTQRRVRISDHAMLRYLERVGGFDIEGLRKSISDRVTAATVPGQVGVTIDGHSFRICEDDWGPVVTTVLIAEGNKSILRPKSGGHK
jgi:hypothetical protein